MKKVNRVLTILVFIFLYIPMVVLIALYGIIREPLTYFMSLTADQIAQIAELLNCSQSTIRNRLMRARNLLKTMLGGEFNEQTRNTQSL